MTWPTARAAPGAAPAIERYLALAKEHGLEPDQMAISFAISRPFVTSAIIGATQMEQLKTDIAAGELTLSEEVLSAIDDIQLIQSNPCP